MTNYYIKDLESLTGIKAHTIRIWEQRYNLVTPKRTATNIRYYNDDDVKLLLNIALLNKKGLKISKIAGLNAEQIHEEALKVCKKRNENDDLINALIIATYNLDEKELNSIFNSYTLKAGFEKTITDLAFPFLQRLGDLWMSNTLHPALEHFASHIVKRKIQNEIENLQVKSNTKKNFLLLLPPGEMHELSLLFSSYMIRNQGYPVIYFGQNTPLTDLYEMLKQTQIDYVLSVFTTCTADLDPSKFVTMIQSYWPEVKILLAGSRLERSDNPCFDADIANKKIKILHNLGDLKSFLITEV